jgi:hypothetical protein
MNYSMMIKAAEKIRRNLAEAEARKILARNGYQLPLGKIEKILFVKKFDYEGLPEWNKKNYREIATACGMIGAKLLTVVVHKSRDFEAD